MISSHLDLLMHIETTKKKPRKMNLEEQPFESRTRKDFRVCKTSSVMKHFTHGTLTTVETLNTLKYRAKENRH